MKKIIIRTLLPITLFAIAMGLLETIVVVYLRELYYPEGFNFPIKIMPPEMVSVELLRELATLVMLVMVGILAGNNGNSRFAWFIYAFAIWDIFYYVSLKALLNWPETLLTWDILFLIPLTWVGPVIAPLINSLTMILLAMVVIFQPGKGKQVISSFEWILLVSGSVIVILSYVVGYTEFMLGKFAFHDLFDPDQKEALVTHASSFIPDRFNWWIFLPGVTLHLLAIGSFRLRSAH